MWHEVATRRWREMWGNILSNEVSMAAILKHRCVVRVHGICDLARKVEAEAVPNAGYCATQVLFRLFIPLGNWCGWFFAIHGFCLSTFLPSLAPQALPRFIATMTALTSARLRSREFLPGQISTRPHDTFPAFSPQPSTTARFSPVNEGCGRKRLPLMRQASPLTRRLAAVVNRIGFTLVWDRRSASGCSPPRLTTTQLPSAAIPLLVSGRLRLSLVDFMYVRSHKLRVCDRR